MAFPQVQSITPSTFTGDPTAHAVSMPATVNAGDLLLCLFSNDGSATVTTPSGWSLIDSTAVGTAIRGGVYAKAADGSEDGTTVDFVTSAGENAAAQVYRITAWSGTVATGVAAGPATDTGEDPNPPNLTPAWGALDTLWIAYSTTSRASGFTSYPTNYTSGTNTESGASITDARIHSARRELNAASENPGVFDFSGGTNWVAHTVAIRPDTTAEYTGSSAGAGTASAALTALASYVGSSAGSCTPSAALNGATAYAGSSAGAATCSGIADAAASYAGSCAGVATQAGELTALASYVGTAAGTGTPSAALTALADYACSSTGIASCSGSVTAALGLSGTSAGTCIVSAQMVENDPAVMMKMSRLPGLRLAAARKLATRRG